MMEVLDVVRQHWAIIFTAGGLVGTAVKLSIDSKYVRHDDLKQLKSSVYDHRERLNTLEHTVNGLPTANDVAELKILMTEIKGDTRALSKEVSGLSHQVGLLIEKEVNKE
ncbi:DUF2730 family protein [Testudinibacter sp. TR-2022]|uniref:DUF2730 family protein n=1 Tax=Testudinibacter sp. TR-2022 TaxID=2585029 RepID=UPI00159BADF5|nr:DUF2730 family protein [Testudinibacter sp. TR-2022]